LDEYVPQGYGQDILDSSGVLNKFAEIRRKFSEGFDKDLDKIDEVLFKYGAVDTPNKMRKKISDQLEAMHTRDAVSRERIRLSTTDPVVEKSKMDKFDKLAPSRHQAAVDVMNIRAKDKEFSDFTVESAVRMYKELNSLNFTDLPREVVSSLRTPINDAMNSLDTAVTDPVIRGFRKGNKAWSDFMKRYPEKSLSKTLIEALNSGNSDIPNIAASGVLSKLKGADPRNIEGMMRNLRRAKRGSPNAQNQAYLVQRSLQQSVVADLMNDVIVNAKELDAMTKEAWDTALTKWGSNPADGMRKIQAVLNKQQGQTVTSLYQLASSSTRRPVNSLTADTEEALFRTLYKQLSNSVWLTLKTPGLAAVVTAGRVVGERAKQKAGKQLAADIMDPYPSMERRLELYMKDPLRFKAEQGASKLPLDERKRRVKSSLGMEAVPYKRMTPEQKQAFHETYRNTYPDLYEFNLRETNRALGRKVISVGGREATTN
jgi:hypothetical protein